MNLRRKVENVEEIILQNFNFFFDSKVSYVLVPQHGTNNQNSMKEKALAVAYLGRGGGALGANALPSKYHVPFFDETEI